MTKADIVHAVYTRLGGFSKKESADLVDLVFETMKETLGRGEKIKISGFGNFVLRDKRQRQGRNPQTGEPITITRRGLPVAVLGPSKLRAWKSPKDSWARKARIVGDIVNADTSGLWQVLAGKKSR